MEGWELILSGKKRGSRINTKEGSADSGNRLRLVYIGYIRLDLIMVLKDISFHFT